MALTIHTLPEETRRSLLAGYGFDPPYMKVHLKTDDGPDDYPDPEAYVLGKELREDLSFIFTADTNSEYQGDLERYNRTRDKINERYGGPVVTDFEGEQFKGLYGYRVTRYTTLTKGGRDQEPEVVDLAELCRQQNLRDVAEP